MKPEIAFNLALVFGITFAGGPVYANPDGDFAGMKQALSRATEGKLRILDDEVLPGAKDDLGEQRYWVVRVEPREAGFYTLVDDFGKSFKFGMFDRRKHVYRFKIAPAGTARTIGGRGEAKPDACLGDRMILVFDVSPRFADHQWKLEFSSVRDEERLQKIAEQLVREGGARGYSIPRGYSKHEFWQILTDVSEIPHAADTVTSEPLSKLSNASSNYLECVSVQNIAAMGHVSTMKFRSVAMAFKAQSPTNFDLHVSLSEPAAVSKADEPDYRYWENTLPVVIVSRHTKLDIFQKVVAEDEYNLTNKGTSSASWSMLEVESLPAVLRVGDTWQTGVSGSWDPSTPLKFETRPFAPRPLESIYRPGVFERIRWKNY